MKKVLAVVLIVLFAINLWGQSINPKLLDLSKAEASFAGNGKIYVKSIYYGGKEIAVILEYDGAAGGGTDQEGVGRIAGAVVE